MLSFWYGRGREKKTSARAQPFGPKPTDSGCILLAVLFPNIRGALCPSISDGCSQLCFACDCCSCVFFLFIQEKKKKKCDYLALTFAFVNIQRLLLVILVPGTSVLQIRWKPFWQLFLYLFAYLGTKTLQKVKLCLCLHVQSSQLHTSLQN